MDQASALALRKGDTVVERATGWLWTVSGTPYRRVDGPVKIPVRDGQGTTREFEAGDIS